MNLSGLERAGKTQIVPCNYVTHTWLMHYLKQKKVQQHRITESPGGRRDLWRQPSPAPHLLKQVQLEQVVQDHIQLSFEYIHGWRFHNFTRQHVPVSDHCLTKKKCFLMSRWNFMFSVCAHCLLSKKCRYSVW